MTQLIETELLGNTNMNHHLVPTLLLPAVVASAICVSVSQAEQASNDSPAATKAIELDRWKLTLPTNDSGAASGHANEIGSSELVAGYADSNFSRAAGGSLIFWCPVTGARTEGTDYPRSELREMTKPGDPSVNWDSVGSHTMTARVRVLQVPSNPKVVIGQIHGYGEKARPLVKLQFFKGRIEALVKSRPSKGKDILLRWPDVGLDADIDYQIKVRDGLLSITVNGVTQTQDIIANDPEWGELTFYFKAGVYPQDNEGPSDEGARAIFTRLSVTHQ